MIKEDYVSFETAKLLKEKGFDERPLFRYDDCGQLCITGGYDKTIKWHFPAPTLQMAMRWLREEFGLFIEIQYFEVQNYNFRVVGVRENSIIKYHKLIGFYDTYEEACEAAIKYCLENLI